MGSLNTLERIAPVDPAFFGGYLCSVWGESGLPCVGVVRDLQGVRDFFERAWVAPACENATLPRRDLPAVMAEIERHDWKEGAWKTLFDVGGISVNQVRGLNDGPSAVAGRMPTSGCALSVAPALWVFVWEGDKDPDPEFVFRTESEAKEYADGCMEPPAELRPMYSLDGLPKASTVSVAQLAAMAGSKALPLMTELAKLGMNVTLNQQLDAACVLADVLAAAARGSRTLDVSTAAWQHLQAGHDDCTSAESVARGCTVVIDPSCPVWTRKRGVGVVVEGVAALLAAHLAIDPVSPDDRLQWSRWLESRGLGAIKPEGVASAAIQAMLDTISAR